MTAQEENSGNASHDETAIKYYSMNPSSKSPSVPSISRATGAREAVHTLCDWMLDC
jgi:hypothetical protein